MIAEGFEFTVLLRAGPGAEKCERLVGLGDASGLDGLTDQLDLGGLRGPAFGFK